MPLKKWRIVLLVVNHTDNGTVNKQKFEKEDYSEYDTETFNVEIYWYSKRVAFSLHRRKILQNGILQWATWKAFFL